MPHRNREYLLQINFYYTLSKTYNMFRKKCNET